MTLVVLLLANGYLVKRADERLNADPSPGNPAWKQFKFSSHREHHALARHDAGRRHTPQFLIR